jgi:hypothetical protein
VQSSASGAARRYAARVPASRPRHTITETPAVHEALEQLRAELDSERVNFAELECLALDAQRELARSGHHRLAPADHLIAVKRAAGRALDLQDIADLTEP